MGVFIIVNEWTDIAGTTSSDVEGSEYYTTEQAAREALTLLAVDYGATMEPNETSFQLEDHTPNLQYEEYYIIELTRA